MDTQWPRFEVFKQDAPGKPHQAVGSVHAADAEHALLMARTVFGRRPNAVSMWVAPEDSILSVTLEELRRQGTPALEPGDALEAFEVFAKTSHKRSMSFADHVGAVRATSARAALAGALEQLRERSALAWWIVPSSSLSRSDTDEATVQAWFEPARDKTYRQQSFYLSGSRKASRPDDEH